jgi:hypothetical protein
MTGLVRKAAVLAACGVILGAAVAYAGVPDPFHSTIPTRINLVGQNSGTLEIDTISQGGLVSVIVRDLAGNPIANSSVVFDFSGTTSDTQIGDSQPYAGATANCSTHGVSILTDVTGTATIAIEGGGLTGAAGPAHAAGTGKVYADGVLLGAINVGEYDLNGANGVDPLDLARLGSDILGGLNPDRSDYNDTGTTDGLDLSVWGAVYFSGRSSLSAATYCP